MPIVWTEDNIEKLIILYGQYQCLWNPFHREFSNKSSRYKAYKEIKNSMNVPELTICNCIKKITNIKKEYCYELSKITAAIFCEKLYSPKAKWFKRLHILLFPYMSSYDTDNFRKSNSNEEKLNDNNIQDNWVHSSFDKPGNKKVCLLETCGIHKDQEIEFSLQLRESIHSALKQQDVFIPPETTKTINAGGQKYIIYQGTAIDKQDCSTYMDDISIEVHSRRKIEDNFDIFGKSVAFQLRSIDIQSAMQLEKEIQNLMTKARLKTLESKQNNTICCCDCSDCKIMCKEEACGCGLTLKECLLLAKVEESKEYEFC